MLDDITQNLQHTATEYIAKNKQKSLFSKKDNSVQQYGQDKISVVIRVDKQEGVSYEQYVKGDSEYLTIYHPYNAARSSYLKIERDITGTKALLKKILSIK